MELSSEDALRLNVMIANAQAVRIDEGRMTVYGLNGEQEMKVPLNPTCRADQYLKQVRELLSGTVLGSPGGYPVFLRRWTRMGQVDNEQLDRLLMLGEPEAVIAVACAPSLSDELARRAWWADQTAENARRMLNNPRVLEGRMGPELARFLIDYLPFETEHLEILENVRLILQPGLIDEATRKRLWDSGRSKKTYRVGFLSSVPDDLPEPVEARADLAEHAPALEALATEGNADAALLRKLLDTRGQTFIEVAIDALKRPADQDVVSGLLNAIGSYFADVRRHVESLREIEAVVEVADTHFDSADDASLQALLEAVPQLREEIRAMLLLAHIDEQVVTPIFARSDAIGTVMRKKIEPVSSVLLDGFASLRRARGQV